MDGGAWMVAHLLERLRSAAHEPWGLDPRGRAGARHAGRAWRAGPLVRAGAVPGLGGAERPAAERGRSMVPNAENREHHRPGQAPTPAAPAAALAARTSRRRLRAKACCGDANDARSSAAFEPIDRLDRRHWAAARVRRARLGIDASADRAGGRQPVVPARGRALRGTVARPGRGID